MFFKETKVALKALYKQLFPLVLLKLPTEKLEESRTRCHNQKKRGKYNTFDAETRATIGQYACSNGVVAAARHFSRKLERPVNESTIRNIKKAYLEEMSRKRKADEELSIERLPSKKRGRPLMLGYNFDTMVQEYLRKVREAGGAVSSRVVIAAAKGILLSCDRNRLVVYGGHISTGKDWALSLLKRMGEKLQPVRASILPRTLVDLKQIF